jgi:hypothetical protein
MAERAKEAQLVMQHRADQVGDGVRTTHIRCVLVDNPSLKQYRCIMNGTVGGGTFQSWPCLRGSGTNVMGQLGRLKDFFQEEKGRMKEWYAEQTRHAGIREEE